MSVAATGGNMSTNTRFKICCLPSEATNSTPIVKKAAVVHDLGVWTDVPVKRKPVSSPSLGSSSPLIDSKN